MRKLPEFSLSEFLEAKKTGVICWSRDKIEAAWQRMGSPKKANALEVYTLLLPTGVSSGNILRVMCHMLPVGFLGFERGIEVYYSYPCLSGHHQLAEDLRKWQEGS